MTSWVDFVIAHRKRVLAAWLALFLLGGFAAANLGGLLSNRFSVPGAESERTRELAWPPWTSTCRTSSS